MHNGSFSIVWQVFSNAAYNEQCQENFHSWNHPTVDVAGERSLAIMLFQL